MTYLDYLEQKVLLERLVIGLEEPVLIKGLGELSAKIDSGNGGYNVIHGTDFHQQGSELMFTTVDGSGNEKKIQSKIIDTIDINMGGGNIESRPVIELDIKFAGEDYKKIPFSVSDRSTNTNPILISKGFVEKELEALIDVGAMNISHEGIDVVYGEGYDLNEGFLDGVKKAVSGTGNFLKGVKDKYDSAKGKIEKFSNAYNDTLNKISNFGKWLGGDAKISDWMDFDKTSAMAESIAQSNEIISDDKDDITSRLINLTLQNTLVKSSQIDLKTTVLKQWSQKKINPSVLPTTLITSYMMTKGYPSENNIIGGLQAQREALLKWIATARIKSKKNRKNTKTDNSSQNQNENQKEQQEETTETPEGTLSDEEFQAKTTQFEQLHNFSLWFISFAKDNDKINDLKKQSDDLKKQLGITNEEEIEIKSGDDKNTKKLKTKLKSLLWKLENTFLPDAKTFEKEMKSVLENSNVNNCLYQIFKSGNVDPSSISPFVKRLAENFQKEGKQGFFCFVYTPKSQADQQNPKRQCHFFEQLPYISFSKKSTDEENGESDNTKDGKPSTDTEDKNAQKLAQQLFNNSLKNQTNTSEGQEEPIFSEDEEDAWIKEKLNYLRQKGII